MNDRARDFLSAQPECWRRCGNRTLDEAALEAALVEAERKGYRDAAREARRYSPRCQDFVEREILARMP